MALFDYGENLVLDLTFGAGTPATLHVALLLSQPTDTDTGSTIAEPSGGSYARVAVTNNATNWPAASGGQKRNGTAIAFPTATADWGVIRYVALCDAGAGGNAIWWGKLLAPVDAPSGSTPTFAIDALTITAD